ncbi:MAG: type II secretion system protein GspE [Desulfobacterales bacterium CG23_combo_of_CG06-09_8_20_14_all_51_8]|nr:MAG: type II secretion system protein GspE [Desulfobacterales bacterium CG23_combo_of_CG06-09_8_20_14_all_51_8]
MKRISSGEYPAEPVVLEALSAKFMKQSKFVPLALTDSMLQIAMADPADFWTIDALKQGLGLDIDIVAGAEDDILEAVDRLYGAGSQSLEMIIEEAGRDIFQIVDTGKEDVDQLRDLASEAPIIRLVNRIILKAVEFRASDIHFEPFEDIFKVRFRVDGVLNEVESPPKRLQAAIISRVKIMADLDIAERRLPQDGRIKLKISGRDIDFRVSTIPTLFGESLVMRVLDREMLILDLEKIGFPQRLLSEYMKLITQPYGMILVTGPTGSGKTSTLYTSLSKINSTENKIITLEDPVEYYLSGVNQIQVNPKIGMTFASGLRSIVRQDPDIILVGEIRDRETAEIAIQSALTGHLLFSTLHTNDSVGAISRLLDMGVEGFLLSSTLLGVLAQRLVRVICPECRRPVAPDEKHLSAMGLTEKDIAGVTFYMGQGCEACRHTGYSGRTAVFEYLAVDAEIRQEISNKSDADRIKAKALAKGLVTLRQNGWEKVQEGVTTLAEVLRVTLEK